MRVIVAAAGVEKEGRIMVGKVGGKTEHKGVPH